MIVTGARGADDGILALPHHSLPGLAFAKKYLT